MQLVLTFPITLMAVHRARLNSISNDFVIEEFKKKPRKTDFGSKFVSVDTSDSEYDEGNLDIVAPNTLFLNTQKYPYLSLVIPALNRTKTRQTVLKFWSN